MAKADKVVLRNEAGAWDLLERTLQKDPSLQGVEVIFQDWPKLEITLKGRDLEGTIPARYLPALQECQESVYKIYSFAKYREYSTRRLKDEERRELELVFRVEKGSSEFAAKMADALHKIAMEAAGKMTPEQLTIFLCLVALLFAGHSGFKHWLKLKERELQVEENKAQRESTSRALEAVVESNRILAEANRQNVERDLARDKLLKSALRSSKASKLAFEAANETYTRLARSMDPGDELQVGNAFVPGVELRSAVTSPRVAAETYDEAGPAIFRSVQNDFEKGYVVSAKFLATDMYINTSIEKNRLTPEEVDCLSKAIFSGKAVWAHIDGKWRRGAIEKARLISIRELEGKERQLVPKSLGGTKSDS